MLIVAVRVGALSIGRQAPSMVVVAALEHLDGLLVPLRLQRHPALVAQEGSSDAASVLHMVKYSGQCRDKFTYA